MSLIAFIYTYVHIESTIKNVMQKITYYGIKIKSETWPSHVIDSPNLSRDTRVKIHVPPWLLGRCSRQLFKSYADANMAYWRAERVYLISKSFAAIPEALNNAYADKEDVNETIIHWLILMLLKLTNSIVVKVAFKLNTL